jgi:hypothetical protein
MHFVHSFISHTTENICILILHMYIIYFCLDVDYIYYLLMLIMFIPKPVILPTTFNDEDNNVDALFNVVFRETFDFEMQVQS